MVVVVVCGGGEVSANMCELALVMTMVVICGDGGKVMVMMLIINIIDLIGIYQVSAKTAVHKLD